MSCRTWMLLAVTLATPATLPVCRLAAAEASSEEQFAYAAAIGIDVEAEALCAQVTATDKSLRNSLQALAEDATPDGAKVAQCSVKLRQLKRLRERLSAIGEPAAIDLGQRIPIYERNLLAVTARFWSLPQSVAIRGRVLTSLGKSHPKRLQELERIAELVRSEKLVEAEQRLDRLLDDTYTLAGCLSPTEAEPISQPIDPVQSLVATHLQQLRSQRADAAIAAHVAEQLSAAKEFVERVEQAAADGVIEPGFLQETLQQWRVQQAAVVKAAYVSRQATSARRVMGAVVDPQATAMADYAERLLELTHRTKLALQKVVAKAIEGIPPAGAPAAYVSLVRIVGEFTSMVGDPEWTAEFEKPLAELSERAGLTAQVAAYREATNDLLRWKARIANAQTAAMSDEYPTVAEIARAELAVNANNEGVFHQHDPSLPRLQYPLPLIRQHVGSKLDGRAVQATDLVWLATPADADAPTGSSLRAVSGWNDNCRLTLNRLPDVSMARKQLLEELWIDSQHPPLTLQTAEVISSRQASHFPAVGGVIDGLHVDAMASVVAHMQVAETATIAVGELIPKTTEDVNPLLSLDFGVEPIWLQSKYYFVRLSPQ